MKIKLEYISSSPLLICCALVAVVASSSLEAESLWPSGRLQNSIANKVAAQRGDILTVVVNQNTTATTTLSTTTNKESSINNQVNQFLFSAAASKFGTHNGELPATNITGSNEYSGGGSITNTQALSDQITVMVSDVLPNGNLVVQGARKVSYSEETQFVVLSGIVRYWDISAQNTIASNQIHDARVEYITEGSITSAQEKGWLEKLNEVINPF